MKPWQIRLLCVVAMAATSGMVAAITQSLHVVWFGLASYALGRVAGATAGKDRNVHTFD